MGVNGRKNKFFFVDPGRLFEAHTVYNDAHIGNRIVFNIVIVAAGPGGRALVVTARVDKFNIPCWTEFNIFIKR